MRQDSLLEFVSELIDWYWQFGVERTEAYTLAPGDFTQELYRLRDGLRDGREGRSAARRSVGVWGPSQTGKSTLLSAFLDARVEVTDDWSRYGEGSALHWPSGERFCFVGPVVAEGQALPGRLPTMNPYNGGNKDASSCLSRFVAGTLTGDGPGHHVWDPGHPVELKLVRPLDLKQAIARGYDTECLGPKRPTRAATSWDLRSLRERIEEAKGRSPVDDEAVVTREAYEQLHELCRILDEFVFAELERYKRLVEDGEPAWSAMMSSILADRELLSQPELVRELTATILWDGYDVVTEWHEKMTAKLAELEQLFAGKRVFLTAEVTRILLDMDSCLHFFHSLPAHAPPDSDEAVYHERIPQIAYRSTDEGIVIGVGEPGGRPLIRSAENFAMLQGLVWELVIPLNLDNLEETPFKEFIRNHDLLDFPGVGNEEANVATRIDFERASGSLESEEEGASRGLPYEPAKFFTQVLKRGKTASIVPSYARRLTVDAFTIVLAIDRFPPVNAKQLINGVGVWWRALDPEFHDNPRGPSPLPLNVAMTWWGRLLQQATDHSMSVFGKQENVVSSLGRLVDPEVSTAFALNYRRFERGAIPAGRPLKPGSRFYETITSEPLFEKYFGDPVSRESFEDMAEDEDFGGTIVLFREIRRQLRQQDKDDATVNREQLIGARMQELERDVVTLLSNPTLFPPPLERDVRREALERFQKRLLTVTEGLPESQMREVAYALRTFLDVDYHVLEEPRSAKAVNGEYIERQFKLWANQQVKQFRIQRQHRQSLDPDWELLGFRGESDVRDVALALAASVLPSELKELRSWFEGLVSLAVVREGGVTGEFRRHLALRMGRIIAGNGRAEVGMWRPDGPAQRRGGRRGGDREPPRIEEGTGRESYSFCATIKPFADPAEGTLAGLVEKPVTQQLRPDVIPGEHELRGLCEKYGFDPDAIGTEDETA